MSNSFTSFQSVVPLGRSVSIDHAAQLLNISRRTVYNRIRDGRLLTLRTLGGSQRVLVDSLRENGLSSRPCSCSDINVSLPAASDTRN